MPVNYMAKSTTTPAPKPWAPKSFGAAGQFDAGKNAFKQKEQAAPAPAVPTVGTSANTGAASVGSDQANINQFMEEKQGFQYASKTKVQQQEKPAPSPTDAYDPNLGKITLGGQSAAGAAANGAGADMAKTTVGGNTDLENLADALTGQGGSIPDIKSMGVDFFGMSDKGTGGAAGTADSDLEALASALGSSTPTGTTSSPLTDNGKDGVMGDGIMYPPYDINGDGEVTADDLSKWEEMTGQKAQYIDPKWAEDLGGDITDLVTGAAGGEFGPQDVNTGAGGNVGAGFDPETGAYVGGQGATNDKYADKLDDTTKAEWKSVLSMDEPTKTPTIQDSNKYGAGLANENESALSQSLKDTSSDVWEKALAQGQADINRRLGSATSQLSDELSARGLGNSGQFFQGMGELQTGAMNEAAQLAINIKKQEIDTALQRLQQTMAFQGELMDDATKRELANQAAELEQQKLNLQTDEQAFNQQQQATEQLQAMAYNLEQMGLDPASSSTIITETLKRLEDQGVPKTAENMMTTMLELIGEHPEWFISPDVTP